MRTILMIRRKFSHTLSGKCHFLVRFLGPNSTVRNSDWSDKNLNLDGAILLSKAQRASQKNNGSSAKNMCAALHCLLLKITTVETQAKPILVD